MSKELKIVIAAVGKGIKQTTNELVGGLQRSSKALKVFNRSVTGGNSIAAGLTDQIKGLVAAYAGFAGISSSIDIIKDAETATYNLQSSVNAANREFKNIGSVAEWEATIGRLSDELVIYSDTALKNAISRTVDMTKRLGLSSDQMEEVIKRSADLGAGKTDLEGAIERVTSALRGEAEASEFLGLTLNENYVKAWYAANEQTGKAWKDLTDIEKAQVRYSVLLEQSAELQGRAAGSAETFAGAVQLVRKEINNAVTENKDMVEAMNDLADTLRENSGEIGEFISQLVTAGARVVEFAVKYKKMLGVIAGTLITITIVNKLVMAVRALNAAFIVLTGLNIVAWISSFRIAMASAAASTTALSIAFKGFIAFAAAEGVMQIINLGKSIYGWRDAMNAAKEAQETLYGVTKMAMDRYKEFANIEIPEDITGVAREDLAKLNTELQYSQFYWESFQKSLREKSKERRWDILPWGDGWATDEAKAAEKELKAVEARIVAINAAIAKVKQASGTSDVPDVDQDTGGGLTDEQLKKIADDQKRLEEQLANELIAISGDKWTVLENKAKKHYADQQALAHGNADLLAEAEKVFSAEMARIQSARQQEILSKEKTFAAAQATSQATRFNQIAMTALASLNSSYAKGEQSLKDYFARRTALIEKQFAYETGKLTRQLDTETDDTKKLQIEDKLFALQEQHTRDLISLKDEELVAEQTLADKKMAIEDMLADMRIRTSQDISSGLGAQFAHELSALDQRHNDELARMESFNAEKEALDEAYMLQKMEKEQLMADQAQRLAEYRLNVAADMAGSLSDIFSDLYDATGENNKELFYLSQAAAIAEATINAYAAANKAWAEGGILGKVQAAITLAGAMANVAKIKAQTLATGGSVLGYSPNEKADNVPIWATAGEFMQPVASVKYYGREVMEAMRRRLIPKDFFSGIRLPSLPSPASFALADGGFPAPAGNSYSVTVPVNVSGGDENLARTLRYEIENTVTRVMRRELR